MVIFMILWRPAGQHLHGTIQEMLRIRGRMKFSSGVSSKSRLFTVARVFGLGPGLSLSKLDVGALTLILCDILPSRFLSNAFGSDIPEAPILWDQSTILKLA
jgi:hypothetical protein